MNGNSARRHERRLRKLFSDLRPEDQQTLLAFAEFLAGRSTPQRPSEIPEPKLIPRPARESVVGAIKRLSASYPMLEKAPMLNETSSLMTQHVMHGRSAPDVIDDLEALFRKHYQLLKEASGEG